MRNIHEIMECQLDEKYPLETLDADFDALADSELVLTYDFKQGGADND